jgi:GAF domain-containing protein
MSTVTTGTRGSARMSALAHRDELLRATVRLARATFRAGAASVFLADPDEDVLILEASAGEGEDTLHGWRLPAHTGVAGWAFQTGQTVVIHDVDADPRFDRPTAESTGYVPRSIIAAPLATSDRTLGVLEVLDPVLSPESTLPGMELVGELAGQCCSALALLDWALGGLAAPSSPAQRLIASVNSLASARDPFVDDLFLSLDRVLANARPERI